MFDRKFLTFCLVAVAVVLLFAQPEADAKLGHFRQAFHQWRANRHQHHADRIDGHMARRGGRQQARQGVMTMTIIQMPAAEAAP